VEYSIGDHVMENFRIIIDGDSCPVLKIIEDVSKEYNIKAIVFCSYAHVPNKRFDMEYKIVDSAPQSVDMTIMNHVKRDDIIVTQDYGLASLVLSKGARAISPNGNIYLNEQIDLLLYDRHLNSEIRRAGGRTKGPRKRNELDNAKFKKNLIKLIEQT
jgi:hypothetical protein